MKNSFKNISIAGVGLIGGSIAKALKSRLDKIQITAISKNGQSLKKALAQGIIDKIEPDFKKVAEDCDLIILALPVSQIIKSFGILSRIKIKSLVVDVGSTKKEIVNGQRQNAPMIRFVATHPLAGKEKNGFENASQNLFLGKKWLICPSKQNTKEDLNSVKKLIKLLGAIPLLISADKHDEILSRTSHLNLLLASILTNIILNGEAGGKIRNFLSGSFRDMTRLAEMNPKIKSDIIFSNKINLLKRLAELKREIICTGKMIKDGDEEKLASYFALSKIKRERFLA